MPYYSILFHTTPYYSILCHTIPLLEYSLCMNSMAYYSILCRTTPYYSIIRETGYLITLIGRAKIGLHVFRCSVFTENIGIVRGKKRHTRLQMFCLPLKVSMKRKKRSSMFVMRPPIFSEGLGFSLLNLYVNPVLCL